MEEQVTTPVEQTAAPTQAEQNLTAMRRKLEAEERAKKDALNELEQLKKKLVDRESAAVDEDYEDEKDKKINYLEQRLNNLEVEATTSRISDFNTVVTDDNLKTLERLYPDEFNSIRYNPDPKQKSRVAYNMIKNYGIATTQSDKAKEKIEENKHKPIASSLGAPQQAPTPLARLDEYGRRRLSDDDRDAILKKLALQKRMS